MTDIQYLRRKLNEAKSARSVQEWMKALRDEDFEVKLEKQGKVIAIKAYTADWNDEEYKTSSIIKELESTIGHKIEFDDDVSTYSYAEVPISELYFDNAHLLVK